MNSGLLRILVLGLVLLVAVVAMIPRRAVPPPEAATELPRVLALPDTSFTDHNGNAFTTQNLTGSFSLLFFGFTNCPDICPLSLQVLAAANALLLDTTSVPPPRVVLISVDPARDNPARLKAYLGNFDAKFVGITTAEENLRSWLQLLGVTVMKQPLNGQNYNMTHNAQIFVTNPDGAIIAIMSSAESPEMVARDYARIRARYLTGTSAISAQQ